MVNWISLSDQSAQSAQPFSPPLFMLTFAVYTCALCRRGMLKDSVSTLEQLSMGASEEDTRPLAFLLAEQVQVANKILVNKTDLVSPEVTKKVEALLKHLNPTADIERTQNSVKNTRVSPPRF